MKLTRRHASIALLATIGLVLMGLCGSAMASPGTGTELVFAGDSARSLGGQVAVPVECLGEARDFCSGTVTLSRAGRHQTVPFSIQGGGRESLFISFPGADRGRQLKLRGVATTSQPLGSPISRETYLYSR